MKKIPLFCKIKKHIAIPSPSAIYFCKYGFKFRPKCLCKNCPNKFKTFKEYLDMVDLDMAEKVDE